MSPQTAMQKVLDAADAANYSPETHAVPVPPEFSGKQRFSQQASCAFGAPHDMKMGVSPWYKHSCRDCLEVGFSVVTKIPHSRLTRAGRGITFGRTQSTGKDA